MVVMYPMLLHAKEVAALWVGGRGSTDHPFSPRGLKQRLAICFLILSFQNLGVTYVGGMCVLVGDVCFVARG